MLFFVVVWVICGLAAAAIAQGKGNAGCGPFLAGLLLGPIGVIIVALMPANPAGQAERALGSGAMKKCPRCAELVQPDAKICRFCQFVFPELTPRISVESRRNVDAAVRAQEEKDRRSGSPMLWLAVVVAGATLIAIGWALFRLLAPPSPPVFALLPTPTVELLTVRELGVVSTNATVLVLPGGTTADGLQICPSDQFEMFARQAVGTTIWVRVRMTAIGADTCSTVHSRAAVGTSGWLRDSDIRAP